jgi:hypothetical protein
MSVLDLSNENGKKDVKRILIDSAIVGLIAFLSVLPGNRLPDAVDIYIAVKTFLYAALFQFSVEYGIRPAWHHYRRNGNGRTHQQNSSR